MTSKNPTGLSRPARIAKRNLSIRLRDDFSDEIISDWLAMWLAGKRPTIVDDARTVSGKRVEEAQRGYVPVSNAEIQWAMKMLVERRDGMPMQAVHLAAEVRTHEMTGGGGAISAAAARALSPAARAMLVEALTGRPQLAGINVLGPAGMPGELALPSEDPAVGDALLPAGDEEVPE